MYNHFKRWEKYRTFEHYFISIENIGFHGIIILPYLHMVAPRALLLYMKKSKNTDTMYNHFKRWEKYRTFEHYFISIENIGSHGIIILPCLHMVAPVPKELIRLRRHLWCSHCIWINQKISIPCTIISNVEKSMGYMNVLSYL